VKAVDHHAKDYTVSVNVPTYRRCGINTFL
jgi:hypothetical protein